MSFCSGKITPKTNLTLLPEFDGLARVPGDKASWTVEDWGWGWAIKSRPYLELVSHNQLTLQARPTSNTTVLYVDYVPPQRERAFFGHMKVFSSLSRTPSAVSLLQVW